MKKPIIIIGGGILLILVIVMLVLGLKNKSDNGNSAQPGSYPSGNFTLTYWKLFDDENDFKPIVEAYKAVHPNATINVVEKNQATYETELVNAIASGAGPDIFEIHNDWLTKHKDKITPSPDSIFSETSVKENFYKNVSENFVNEAKVYAIPYSIETLALLENTDLKAKRMQEIFESIRNLENFDILNNQLSNEPQTWDDVVAQAKYLTKKRGNWIDTATIALGTSNNITNSADILSMLMLQNKTKMVSDDKTVPEFNLPIKSSTGQDQYVGTRALNFYASFAQSNKEDYSWNSGMYNNLSAFIKEKLIMTFAYPYEINTILQKNPSLKIKVIKTPQVKGTDESLFYPSYWGETVSRNSKNSYAAWDFIKFISDDNSGILSQFLNSTKRFSAKINDKFAPSYPQVGSYSLYVEQLENAKSWYKGINPTKVISTFNSMIQKVVTGKEEAQRAIDTAAADLRPYFQQVTTSTDNQQTSNQTPVAK